MRQLLQHALPADPPTVPQHPHDLRMVFAITGLRLTPELECSRYIQAGVDIVARATDGAYLTTG